MLYLKSVGNLQKVDFEGLKLAYTVLPTGLANVFNRPGVAGAVVQVPLSFNI